MMIGSDASGILPGMMIPNDNFGQFFNIHGKFYNDPMKEESEKSQNDHTDNNPDLTAPQEEQHTTTEQDTMPTQPAKQTQTEGKPT